MQIQNFTMCLVLIDCSFKLHRRENFRVVVRDIKVLLLLVHKAKIAKVISVKFIIGCHEFLPRQNISHGVNFIYGAILGQFSFDVSNIVLFQMIVAIEYTCLFVPVEKDYG